MTIVSIKCGLSVAMAERIAKDLYASGQTDFNVELLVTCSDDQLEDVINVAEQYPVEVIV